jgi:magnesium and cobalt transporter
MTEEVEEPPSKPWMKRFFKLFRSEPESSTQLVESLRLASKQNILNAHVLAMLEGVMQVSDMKVRDIMVPRAQMKMVKQDDLPEVSFPHIVESAHSRFPVILEDRAEVVGILLAKDLLQYCIEGRSKDFKMRDVMRKAIFVPESKKLDALLLDFQTSHNHMAIVVDEYGAASGLVTIEDVLEQIVGEIEDEHDVEEDGYILKHTETEFIIKALTPVEDFNEIFDREIDETEFDTVGGVVTGALGHVPKRGEKTRIGPYLFKVLRADNRRAHLLKLNVEREYSTSEDE